MRQVYHRMQEEILPHREKQDEIWDNIKKKTEERRGKSSRRYALRLAGGIAATLLVCVFCLPQTGFADNIKGFLNRYFDKSASVEENIVENVYEDSDGHVKMQVTKMLSDGACAYLDICYKALDETGEDWLANAALREEAIEFLYGGDIVGRTAGYSSYLEEYKDMATKQARYFTFCYHDVSGNFNMNTIERILSYPMYGKKGRGKIKVSSNIDTFAYRLEGEGSPSKFYQPQYILVSKLSFGIFGKDHGVYNRDKHGNDTSMNEDFVKSPDSDINNVTFIMEDGSKIEVDGCAGYSPALNVSGYDLNIVTGYFHNEEDSHWEGDTWCEKLITINPKELAEVVINNVHYNLVPDKLSK